MSTSARYDEENLPTPDADVNEPAEENDEMLPKSHAMPRSSGRFDFGLYSVPSVGRHVEYPEVSVVVESVLMQRGELPAYSFLRSRIGACKRPHTEKK